MSEWQDISTAPKSGVVIYGCNNKMGQEGLVFFNRQSEWELVNGMTNWPLGTGFYPTHWHPRIPLPPYASPVASYEAD